MRLRHVALAAVVLLSACGYIPGQQAAATPADCASALAPATRPQGLGSLGYYEPGGYALLVLQGSTWKWSCDRWTPLVTGWQLEMPVGFLAYEPHLRMVVGFYKSKLKGWDGKAWVEIGDGPPEMAGLTYLAFDQARDQLVALTSISNASRTWTYAKGKWTKVATEGPRGYFGSAFAYDVRSKTTVLFGHDCFDAACNGSDTWAWDGKSWKQLHPATSPSKGHGLMAFDAATNQFTLLAADSSMWTWDGTNWHRLSVSAPASGRYEGLVYDRVGRQLLLWTANSTWAFKAGRWSGLTPTPPSTLEPLPPASTARTNPPDQTPVASGARLQSWNYAPCRIPYADISEATGGFVELPSGERYADPAATVALPGGTPGRIGQNPGLTYLADVRRWVPVPARWVSPDQTLYVYELAGQIRAVKIAVGASAEITADSGWLPIGPGSDGVYIAKPGIKGAWFVPYGGVPRQIADHGRWDAYSSGYLFGWDDSNHLLRLDVVTGAESRWGAKQYGWVAGFDRQVQPFVITMGSMWLAHSDGSFTLIWNGDNDHSAGAPVLTDARGTWFSVGGGLVGRPGHGFYLYELGGKVKYVVGLDAILAGLCA